MRHRRVAKVGRASVAAAAVLLAAGCAPRAEQSAPQAAAVDAAARIERGRYLVQYGGCNDCHTPYKMGSAGPEPDLDRRLSGHPAELAMPPAPELPPSPWVWVGAATNTAFAGPWGVSFATNLTPDAETGIGGWQEQTFVQSMRTGRHLGVADARPILPPMPWPNVGQLTDDDLSAIFAYLRSLPPIPNRVPESIVAPPPAPAEEGSRP